MTKGIFKQNIQYQWSVSCNQYIDTRCTRSPETGAGSAVVWRSLPKVWSTHISAPLKFCSAGQICFSIQDCCAIASGCNAMG